MLLRQGELPAGVAAQLSKRKNGLLTEKVCKIIGERGVTTDDLLIKLWKKHQIEIKRSTLQVMLSRLIQQGRVVTKKRSGFYKLNPKQKG